MIMLNHGMETSIVRESEFGAQVVMAFVIDSFVLPHVTVLA